MATSPRESHPLKHQADSAAGPAAPPLEGWDGNDRRRPADRRQAELERRNGLERRRGPGRRRSDLRRAAEEGEITDELLEFVMTMDEYKRVNKKPFPSWSEVYQVVLYLGYRKIAELGSHIDKVSPALTTPGAK